MVQVHSEPSRPSCSRFGAGLDAAVAVACIRCDQTCVVGLFFEVEELVDWRVVVRRKEGSERGQK